jgi:hypothetical protein
VVTQVQAGPSGVEVEADIQSELRDTRQAAQRMHPLSGPAMTAASVGQDAQGDLDTADGFQDTYLKPLRIFDDVIGKIADVWTLISIGTELIRLHRYILTQRWHWAYCLAQPKCVSFFFLPILHRSAIIPADYSSSSGPRRSGV